MSSTSGCTATSEKEHILMCLQLLGTSKLIKSLTKKQKNTFGHLLITTYHIYDNI